MYFTVAWYIIFSKSRDVKLHLEFLLFLSFSHPVTAVLILFSQETRLGLRRSWQPEQLLHWAA